jgi:hypothetical protein
MSKRAIQTLLVILLPMLLAGCFAVRVKHNVKNPEDHFKRAYARIDRIQRRYPDRKGRPHEINLLIYEHSSRQLIEVNAPFWLVNKCKDFAIRAGEDEDEFDYEDRYDFDWRNITDLRDIGPGLLVEIEDEDNKILIWIE